MTEIKSSGTGHFRVGGVDNLTVSDILDNAGWIPSADPARPARNLGHTEFEALQRMNDVINLGGAEGLRGALREQQLRSGVANYDSRTCTNLLTRIAAGPAADYLLEIKGSDGTPILKSDLEKDAALKIVNLLDGTSGSVRAKILADLMAEYAAERKAKRIGRLKAERDVEQLKRLETAMNDIQAWEKQPLRLERQHGSHLHKFCDTITEETILAVKDEEVGYFSKETGAKVLRYCQHASVFVIQHDWARAFADATDFDDVSDVKLPDSHCIFEFRISGRTVIAFVYEDEKVTSGKACTLQIATGDTFICNFEVDDLPHIHALVDRSIRAIAVALEAEVASTEIVEPPHKLNRQRLKRNRAPLASYHVVNLARRQRLAVALARDPDAPPSHRKRLHFRRGHWSHYGMAGYCITEGAEGAHTWKPVDKPAEEKGKRRQLLRHFCACGSWRTWRKWNLVGDPELGWVDKEYRL